ncbi:MAG: asparagine synthase (glutamine-hydrolyzing) [Nitrococcus sp.]|nr:asparagine synthase (glutamine-hydrolyzing) [Nitrococcus sp.]
MCGIAGWYDSSGTCNADELENAILRATAQLVHRGPDDGGVYVDAPAGIALGHRRLSIIDLSPEGHQPMCSASGRYAIAFNGEIYNFRELTHELNQLGHRFRGHSDTEVLLAAIEQWGLKHALQRSNGMVALALWDRETRKLTLARDRVGKKPLYYGWTRSGFAFGSELKAIRALPSFDATINRDALTLLLRHKYIPAPFSIYRGIFKLRPAEVLILPLEAMNRGPIDPNELRRYRRTYWSFHDTISAGMEQPWRQDDNSAIGELQERLLEAVRLRMVSDVPLGALLSGGIDSSIVTALMQRLSNQPIETFSIGFNESDYDEAQHASRVAAHLGTEHTELYVTPEEAMAVIPRLPAIYDEPFADCSQIPTFLVSQLARKRVTVALSGDGGDELFGGYNRYILAYAYWRRLGRLPRTVRHLLTAAIEHVPAERWNRLLAGVRAMLPRQLRVPQAGDKLLKLAHILHYDQPIDMYRALCSDWIEPDTMVIGASDPTTVLDDSPGWPQANNFIDRMMQLDFLTYLPGDILTKVDRASMAVSLEVRCPLLDPDVIAFAWRLPLHMKIRNGEAKWLLRQLLYRHVPRELVERPKMGFGVPIDQWLRGALRDWADALLDERRLKKEGFFDPNPIRRRWQEHLSGRRHWHYSLWNVLMFQAWLEHSNPSVSYSVAETVPIGSTSSIHGACRHTNICRIIVA